MRQYLFALLLLCAALPAFASDPTSHWVQVQSPHFIVYTDTNEKQARHVAAQFEQMSALFHVLIPNAAPDDSGAPMTVLALKNSKDLLALMSSDIAKNEPNVTGLVMWGGKNYTLLRLNVEAEHPFAAIYSEYTLFLLRKDTWMPLWLRRGLSWFYENTDIYEKEVILGQPSPNTINYLRERKLIPLTTLFQVDSSSPYDNAGEKATMFAAESWALTHYIQIADHQNRANRLHDYATNIAKGEDPVAAAEHAFGDLNKLQQALQTYIDHGEYRKFGINTNVSVDPNTFSARPVSDPEINALRADVLSHTGRVKESQELLEAVLHDDPNNALAHETMGFLKFQASDFSAAKKWFEEAVQLNPQSFFANYFFAITSERIGDRSLDAAIESSYRAAIKLNPSFALSYDKLAQFYLSRDEKLDDAYSLTIQAIQLDPSELDYRLAAARVLSKQQNYVNAINVLKRALPVAKTPKDISLVQSRLSEAEKLQASSSPAQNP